MKNKFDRSVSMLCWAFNEEESIHEFLQKAEQLLESVVVDYEIVLIDDGSNDKTYEIASNYQKKNKRLIIFRNKQNRNIGFCCKKAIKKASKEYLFWQTCDWSYDIASLGQYLELLKKYDIVQGVRVKPVDDKNKLLRPLKRVLQFFGIKHLTRRSDTVLKALISLANYFLIRTLFRVPLDDFQNVTIYPTRWVQSIKYETCSSFANPEGLIKSYWSGKSIVEVPINFIARKKGVATGSTPKMLFNAIKDIFILYVKWILLGKRGEINKGKIVKNENIFF
jgi:glycosyltransferase involved in cell wall biosynthesis